LILDRLSILFARRPRTAEAWLARMARPGVGVWDQASLRAWLEADPDHLRQYEQAKADQMALAGLEGAFAGDLARLRRSERRSNAPRRLVLAGGLAVAAVAGAVVLAPMLRGAPESILYESAPRQIRDLTLDDGSRMTLDAGSAVRVAFAEDVRRVTLERGAAYFEVAHDASHPFQVGVADRRVIVTGTRFVTALTGDGGEVSLLQGRVVVGRGDAAKKGALDAGLVLAPGERAVFRRGQPGVRKAAADVETATAWRQRRLIFRDAPLSAVVAAASRYSETPLVVADPSLDQVRVTAILPLEGEGDLSDRMAGLLPIRTERTDDGRILVRGE
jgi:transmembrane sensor